MELQEKKVVAMDYIAELLRKELQGKLPYLNIQASNDIMDCVTINGSFNPKEEWKFGIFQNSVYFQLIITPCKGKRWYKAGEKVIFEFMVGNRNLIKPRKYTSTVCKVVPYIQDWISSMIIKLAEDKIKQG